jgi:hypothetical protein
VFLICRLFFCFVENLDVERRVQNLLKLLVTVSGLVFIIPGFYIPPFFDGIAGWYIEKDDPKSYSYSQIRINFTDGQFVWFKSSFFNPITQRNRPIAIIRKRDSGYFYSSDFAIFLKQLYIRAYPALQEGRLPTQNILGSMSYPPIQ